MNFLPTATKLLIAGCCALIALVFMTDDHEYQQAVNIGKPPVTTTSTTSTTTTSTTTTSTTIPEEVLPEEVSDNGYGSTNGELSTTMSWPSIWSSTVVPDISQATMKKFHT